MNLNRYKSLFNYRFILSLSLLLILSLFLLANTRDQLGDVNNDGFINVQDIVLVVDIILNDDIEYGEYELWASDVNDDDATDISDIVIIVVWILDPPEITDCPEYYSPCTEDTTECCLDTTSHEFDYFIDTLGIYYSWINDVTIIDDNDVWAACFIKIADSSSSTGYTRYNAAHWDGDEWELLRIFPPPFYFAELKSIFVTNSSEIWVGGTAPMSNMNDEWIAHSQFPTAETGWINDIWGTSSNNIYFAGSYGAIVHYDGSEFTLMETPTDVPLYRIHGSIDGDKVFAVGWSIYTGQNVIYRLDDGSWDLFYSVYNIYPGNDDYGYVYTAYQLNDTTYFSSIAGLWKYNHLQETSILIPANDIFVENDTYSNIIVNSPSDIFLVGSHQNITHFNGSTWYLNYDFAANYDFQSK